MLLLETRTWQFVKSGRPFSGEGCAGDRQLKMPCGLMPWNGTNWWFRSEAANETFPLASAIAGDGDETRSQFTVGDQPRVVGGVPSHCSTKTFVPGVNPLAAMVNACGVPPVTATVNGFAVGEVMVAP